MYRPCLIKKFRAMASKGVSHLAAGICRSKGGARIEHRDPSWWRGSNGEVGLP